MKKYLAELFGTFGLTLAVLATATSSHASLTPFVAAVTLGLFVYTVGHVSGTHINPAVTLGALTLKKISLKDSVGYIICQLLGASAALLLAGAFIPQLTTALSLSVADNMVVFFAEVFGALFFTFGIASVVFEKTPSAMNGFVIGGSLFIGIFVAGTASLGVLNPAVALGLGAFNLSYILGPIVGSILGMSLYRSLAVGK